MRYPNLQFLVPRSRLSVCAPVSMHAQATQELAEGRGKAQQTMEADLTAMYHKLQEQRAKGDAQREANAQLQAQVG